MSRNCLKFWKKSIVHGAANSYAFFAISIVRNSPTPLFCGLHKSFGCSTYHRRQIGLKVHACAKSKPNISRVTLSARFRFFKLRFNLGVMNWQEPNQMAAILPVFTAKNFYFVNLLVYSSYISKFFHCVKHPNTIY